jgi:formate dehydrogenase
VATQICDRDAVVNALETGHLAGYGGDVWCACHARVLFVSHHAPLTGVCGTRARRRWPQPAPASHPWRKMPHNAMTPHMSGTTLSAQARSRCAALHAVWLAADISSGRLRLHTQARYAAATQDILHRFLHGKPIPDEYIIVRDGQLAGVGAQSYGSKANV